MSRTLSRTIAALIVLATASDVCAQGRPMQPEDLFRLERIGVVAWTSDLSRAAVEIHRAGQWLGQAIPTADIAVVDAETGALQIISPSLSANVGFFGPSWSPDNRRLLFLSVDRDAIVRPWLWSADRGATPLPGLELADGLADPPAALWSDAAHALFRVRQPGPPHDGPLYFAILRGKNVADLWTRAQDGREAAVNVLDSRRPESAAMATAARQADSSLVSVNVDTGTVATIASGAIHRPTLSADRTVLTYSSEAPPFTSAPVSSFFGPDAVGDAAYDRVNWGTEVHRVDARTGAEVVASPPGRPNQASARPALRVASTATEGTRLLLTRIDQPEIEVWRGNTWVREIQTGRVEAVAYQSCSGQSLTGWLLYPPSYTAGQRVPAVTIVYPGTVYGTEEPRAFNVIDSNFEHPQLFAALGYAVLLPSMPDADNLEQPDAVGSLSCGVLPFVDVVVGRGIADRDRIAVLGQSAGGWATLGLITSTGRFKTAIASAAYSDMVSLYGTFYGQYRYGDAGDPQRAQVLRMLQLERGSFSLRTPPWEQPDRYHASSPIYRIASVSTPLMLIHGEQDFIPIQQAEEFFTALLRQDKRARLVRYGGETHTITARANVLDLWQRMADWLRETMPPNAPQ